MIMFTNRALLLMLAATVPITFADNPRQCSPGIQNKCCKDPVYTCAAPTFWTGPYAGVTLIAYKENGECCCCSGGTNRNVYVQGDWASLNDQGMFSTTMQSGFNQALNQGSQNGWCEQQLSPSQTNFNLGTGFCNNRASCRTQSVKWCDPLKYPQNPPPPGSVNGDPHVKAFDGSTIEFNGVSGMSFALISEPATQVNVLLHDFSMDAATFIKSVGLKHAPSNTTVTVTSPDASCTPDRLAEAPEPLVVVVNGETVELNPGFVVAKKGQATHVPATAKYADVDRDSKAIVISTQFSAGNGTKGAMEVVTLSTSSWTINVERSAKGCHLDLSVQLKEYISPSSCGGILCESLGWRENESVAKMLQGDEAAYMVNNILDHNFQYSHFGEPSVESSATRRLLALATDYKVATWTATS